MLLRFILQQVLREKAEQSLREAMNRASETPGDSQSQPNSPFASEGDEEAQVEPLPPCEVALLFASEIEAGGMIDRLEDKTSTRCVSLTEHRGTCQGRSIAIGVCHGTSTDAVRQATLDLISFHHPQWMINAGFAAALEPEIVRGTILMAEQIVDSSGHQLDMGLNVDRESMKKHDGTLVGRLLTADRVLRSRKEREKSRETFSAIAADLDSAIVAQVCQQHGVRLIAIRAISDELDDKLPAEVRQFHDQKTIAGKLGATAGALMRRPSALKDLWDLKQQGIETSDKLARFLGGVIRQLP